MRIVALLALVACMDTGPGPQPKKIERKLVQANLLTAVPEITHLDVNIGGMVQYVGNTTDRPLMVPGQTLRITHYWHVLMPPGPGWRVFAYLRGAAGSADFMNLETTDMELGHPVDKWRTGEIIADAMDIAMRPDWKSRTATLYVGIVRTGGHDTGDRLSATGPNTLDRAVIAKTFDVDLSKAPPPPGTVYIPHASGPIAIDGIAMDRGWATAATSPEFLTAEGSPEPVGKATAKLTWDEDNLYVFVQVTDTDIYSEYKQHDQPLWKADAVELFIDADGNRQGYVELQVNPNNATFDSWFAATRAQPGDEKWDSGMVTAVKVRGTPDVAGDSDSGWDVEIAIPYAAVKGRDDNMKVNIPPQVGDRWRMNVVRVDSRTGSKEQSASSWNRITYGDFHALDRMLTVVFADQTGSITAKPAGAEPQGSGAAPGAVVPPVTVVPANGSNAVMPVRPATNGSNAVMPVRPATNARPTNGSNAPVQPVRPANGSNAPRPLGALRETPATETLEGKPVGSGSPKRP